MSTPPSYKWIAFPSSVVRECCAKIYGKSISSHAWRNWRKWAGVQKGQKVIEVDCFIELAAIAELRRQRQFSELRSSEVEAIVNKPQFQEKVMAAAAYLDRRNYIQGRDVLGLLSSYGLRVSRTSLYKRLPGFSVKAIYPVHYVFEVFS
jgi:hypothetical protein